MVWGKIHQTSHTPLVSHRGLAFAHSLGRIVAHPITPTQRPTDKGGGPHESEDEGQSRWFPWRLHRAAPRLITLAVSPPLTKGEGLILGQALLSWPCAAFNTTAQG